MRKIIVTGGAKGADIDVLACCLGYAELLNLEGKEAVPVIAGQFTMSVTSSILAWGGIYETKHETNEEAEFVLVDVSDPEYFPAFVNLDSVVEVYDHRYGYEKYWEKIGNNNHIEMVGACGTLIWEEFMRRNKDDLVSISSVRLLLASIVSNTLNFNSPLTTERDKTAYSQLSKITNLPSDWIQEYFREQEQQLLQNFSQYFEADTKIVKIPSGNLAIAQVELWSGAGLSNTWSYNNYLTQSQGGGTASTTYLYDNTGQRIMKVSGGITTKYPNAYYEAKGATTTKHIYVGDLLTATIESGAPAPTVYYNHLDHLGSTQVVTGEDGYLTQELSYYPYGATRIDNQYGPHDELHRYIGQEYDEESSMSYLNARYYKNDRGQFISQDPLHLAIGDNSKFSELMPTMPMQEYLKNPQALNSYSYAGNNPIRFSDPKGLWYGEFSGSVGMYGLSGSLGVRFNDSGVVWFGSPGVFAGAEFALSGSFSSGEINVNESEVTVSRGGRLAAGAGIGVSREGTYDPTKPLSLGNNRSTSYSAIVGLGGGVGQEYTKTQPLIKFGNDSNNSGQNKSTTQQANKSSNNTNLTNTMNKLISTLKSYIKILKKEK